MVVSPGVTTIIKKETNHILVKTVFEAKVKDEQGSREWKPVSACFLEQQHKVSFNKR